MSSGNVPPFGDSGSPRPDRIGRYNVIGLLGVGKSTSVYLAHDPSRNADVAVKVLAAQHGRDPGTHSRFIDEARALQRLTSDRVVSVYDIGDHDGLAYFAMQYVTGGTLEDRLVAREAAGLAPAPEDIERLVSELADGLTEVHDAGLVHRDIKPSNLLIGLGDLPPGGQLLAADERLIIGDFGLGRPADSDDLTSPVAADRYSAPEQPNPTAPIDARSDVHAAAAVVGRSTFGPRWRSILVTDPTTGAMALEPAGSEPLTYELRRAMSARVSDRHRDIDDWSDAVLSSFEEATAPPAPPQRQKNTRRLAAAGLVVLSMLATAGVLSGTQVVEQNSVTTAFTTATGEPDGPDIAGPDQVALGSLARFSHPSRAGVQYRWEAPAGAEVDGNTISYAPQRSGDFEITLIETTNGVQRTTTRSIRVLNA